MCERGHFVYHMYRYIAQGRLKQRSTCVTGSHMCDFEKT